MASTPRILTQSAIASFDCPAKYKYAQLQGLVPLAKREALGFGTIAHRGLEKGLPTALAELRAEAPMTQQDADRQRIQEAVLYGMLGNVPWQHPADMEREPEWDIPIINPDSGRTSRTYRICGKADGIYGGWIYEYKTCSQLPIESAILKLSIDRQVMNEIYCLQRARDITVQKVHYCWLRKPTIKQKQNETLDQYCERVVADYAERPEFYFKEETLLVDQDNVRQWERDLWNITKTLRWYERGNYWYRNTSRCSEWGGCEYLPICRGEDVEGLYRIEERHQELTKEEAIATC